MAHLPGIQKYHSGPNEIKGKKRAGPCIKGDAGA